MYASCHKLLSRISWFCRVISSCLSSASRFGDIVSNFSLRIGLWDTEADAENAGDGGLTGMCIGGGGGNRESGIGVSDSSSERNRDGAEEAEVWTSSDDLV